MGFFNTSGQHVTEFSTYPCVLEEVFIMGLKEGEKLISYDPFIIFSHNGLAVGINESFNQFYLIDKTSKVLDTLNLSWKTECFEQIEETNHEEVNLFLAIEYNPLEMIIPSTLILIGFIYFIRRMIHA